MVHVIGGEARAALPRRFVLVEAGGYYSFCSFVRPRGEVRDTTIWWVYRAREGNSNDIGYAWFRGVVVYPLMTRYISGNFWYYDSNFNNIFIRMLTPTITTMITI